VAKVNMRTDMRSHIVAIRGALPFVFSSAARSTTVPGSSLQT